MIENVLMKLKVEDAEEEHEIPNFKKLLSDVFSQINILSSCRTYFSPWIFGHLDLQPLMHCTFTQRAPLKTADWPPLKTTLRFMKSLFSSLHSSTRRHTPGLAHKANGGSCINNNVSTMSHRHRHAWQIIMKLTH